MEETNDIAWNIRDELIVERVGTNSKPGRVKKQMTKTIKMKISERINGLVE